MRFEPTSSSKKTVEYAANLDEGMLVLTEDGEPVAALVPIDRDDVDSLSLAGNAKFQPILESARRERAAGRTHSAADVRRELGLD
jgi:antitoxin (DNA-binding transcriptional repressor) of toxin-antitoxin stability system